MREKIIALNDRRGERSQHAGLMLQRYLCEPATGEDGNSQEKRAVLQAAINAARHDEVRTLYQAAFERWSASLPADSKHLDLQTIARLIVGLGTENVLETGIRLHHTYGMPIIPGSALKGLAAHYCDQVWGREDPKFKKPKQEEGEGDNFHRLLFGTTEDSGSIIFHDAWYVPDSSAHPLALDVMTPHHPDFQGGPESQKFKPPTDFDSPIPVPFLSVNGTFRIGVSWNGPDHEQASAWTTLALTLLEQALADWGVGGKTSSGYGRLGEPRKEICASETTQPKQAKPTQLPKANESVQAVLLPERTKKGGWKAKHEPSGLSGPIQNSGEVPDDKQPEDTVTLVVASANQQEIAFRYPTGVDAQRTGQSKEKTTRR